MRRNACTVVHFLSNKHLKGKSARKKSVGFWSLSFFFLDDKVLVIGVSTLTVADI
jgi:hypothetical protein